MLAKNIPFPGSASLSFFSSLPLDNIEIAIPVSVTTIPAIASGLISFVISMGVSHWFFGRETATDLIMPSLYAILFIAFLTLLTVGYKIHKVSKLNPATIIKKE